MIILTKEEAELVHGKTSDNTALEPVLLADGITWILPDEVLDDPNHKAVHKYLATKQKREVTEKEWRKGDEQPLVKLTDKAKDYRVKDPEKEIKR